MTKDLSGIGISKVHTRLKKFSDDACTDLLEVIISENGVVIDTWKKGDDRPPPEA